MTARTGPTRVRDLGSQTVGDGEGGERIAGPFLSLLAQPWSVAGLTAGLERFGRAEGFSRVAILTIPSVDEKGAEMRVLASNWTEEFRRGFERLGLHRYTPVVRAMVDGIEPLPFDAETLHGFDPDDPEPNPRYRFLEKEEASAGVYCPVHGFSGFCGVLALFGTQGVGETDAARMQAVAFEAFGVLAACRFEENRRNNPLTTRERECLALAMYGKTSGEIATILQLSEHTVSQYFTAAQRKLDASNRTHAVARAAQLGYLS